MSVNKPDVVPLVVFVDWNFQRHCLVQPGKTEPDPIEILEHVAEQLWGCLAKAGSRYRFEVSLRLYSGWHREGRKTQRRQRLGALTDDDLIDLSSNPRMVFRQLSFGERASFALDRRLVNPDRVHYLNTTERRKLDNGTYIEQEKMVDTALVADLVATAADSSEKSWLIVAGEDRDLLPGVYTAEAFLHNTGRRIAFLRTKNIPHSNWQGLNQLT